MGTQFLAFTLSVILVTGVGLVPAFGQGAEHMIISTDKTTYDPGETIVIEGQVRDRISTQEVTITILAPNESIIGASQLRVGEDNMFRTEIATGGGLWKYSGTYTIKAIYGSSNRAADAIFEYTSDDIMTPGPSSLETFSVDGIPVGYSITGGSVISIEADADGNSLVIIIETTDDGELTISLPSDVIVAKVDGGREGADDDFVVLIDDEEVDGYRDISDNGVRTLTIPFSDGSERIEIIGTWVIPEFGTIAVLILAVAIISIIAISSRSRLSIMPKY